MQRVNFEMRLRGIKPCLVFWLIGNMMDGGHDAESNRIRSIEASVASPQ
jgi:hypothetical protein